MKATDTSGQLAQQIQFLIETEKLKAILRRNSPINTERSENSAEHSWSLALMAIVLAGHANQQTDLLRVLKMVLIHDIVEIDAGDFDAFDTAGHATKADCENRAAERIFNLLPASQAVEFRELWQEFESRVSPESVFANALDRLMPLIQNFHNAGKSWRERGVTSRQSLDRSRPIGDASSALWDYARALVAEGQKRNFYSPADEKP
jgi:putative hydrolases of HD superfamily